MLNRWKNLVREAEKQLQMAEAANAACKPVWAWFAAHESAEKALKALRLKHQLNGQERMITRLLLTLPEDIPVPLELVYKAHHLDSHYLPIQLEPTEQHTPRAHGKVQSEEAMRLAAEILAFVKSQLDLAQPEVTPALEMRTDTPVQSPIEPMTA